MKQKNLVLMVVAVGCGLVAAFLTATMSARPKADVQTIEIIVALKELTPGTKFTKESLKDQITRKKVLESEAPPNVATLDAELIDKTLTKSLRTNDFIGLADLGMWEPLKPPSGYDLVTIRLPLDKMTPFVKPTSRVDLLGTVTTRKNNMVAGTTLIPNMLVMAIDANTQAGSTKDGILNIQVVTLAAKKDEAKLIRLAEKANVDLSFILLGDDNPMNSNKGWTIEAVIKWINDAIDEKRDNSNAPPGQTPPPQPTPEPQVQRPMVKVHVAKVDLPAGTELSADVIKEKFKEVEVEQGQVPDNVVANLNDSVGKYLTRDLDKGLYVPKKAIGDKPGTPEKSAARPKAEPKPEEKHEEFDRSITQGTTTKVYRFRKDKADGLFKMLGEVRDDGSVAPVAGGVTPDKKKPAEKPDEAPSDEKKADEKKVI